MKPAQIEHAPQVGRGSIKHISEKSSPEIKWADRLSGAFDCSVEASVWMVQIGLIVAVWITTIGVASGLTLMKVLLGRRR